jgi:hypothetical protein
MHSLALILLLLINVDYPMISYSDFESFIYRSHQSTAIVEDKLKINDRQRAQHCCSMNLFI